MFKIGYIVRFRRDAEKNGEFFQSARRTNRTMRDTAYIITEENSVYSEFVRILPLIEKNKYNYEKNRGTLVRINELELI